MVKGKILKQQKRLKEIWQKSKETIGCSVNESAEFEARNLAEKLENSRKIQKEIESRIAEICNTFPEYHSLLSIPGFGPVVSSITLAAIGDPNRFQNRKQVLKLVGLDLSASRSGKGSTSAIAKISKKGKADLRYALYQSAVVASTRSEVFISYFENRGVGRTNERGIGTKMRVKLAAKLLVIPWTLMKKKEQFCTDFLTSSDSE